MNKIMKNIPLTAWMGFAVILLLSATDSAFAQTTSIHIQGTGGAAGGGSSSTLGDMFSNGCSNTIPFAEMFASVAYASAALCTVLGIHHFRLHADSPANNPMNKPLMLFCGASLLFVMPSVLVTVASSLGYYVSPTMAGCQAAGSAGGAVGASGIGLDVMLANFVGNIANPLVALVQVIANVCGVWMMVNGLMKASKYGYDPKSNSVQSILTNVAFGAILFTIGGNFSVVMASVFGTSTITSPSAISWNLPTSVSPQFTTAIAAALEFIQVVGFIAFVRGWLLLKKVVEGGSQSSLGQAITHIVGGVLAINIPAFLKIMDTTFGTGLLN